MMELVAQEASPSATSRPSLTELFTMWWHVRWLRVLVTVLSPIGLIDSIFTVLLFHSHGSEVEYNPVVRFALDSALWPVWFGINTATFPLLVMFTCSYYLYTRNQQRTTEIKLLTLVIALRIFGATYDVLVYMSEINSLMWAMITRLLSYLVLSRLLSRTKDISVVGVRRYLKMKYDNFYDMLLIKGLIPEVSLKKDVSESGGQDAQALGTTTTHQRTRLQKAMWVAGAIVVLILVPFILDLVARLPGGALWREKFGSFFYWNQMSGLTFVLGFVITIILFSIIMYFLMNVFDDGEGAW